MQRALTCGKDKRGKETETSLAKVHRRRSHAPPQEDQTLQMGVNCSGLARPEQQGYLYPEGEFLEEPQFAGRSTGGRSPGPADAGL